MDCSMPGFPVHHQLPELAQTHVHQVIDAIQPSHPLSVDILSGHQSYSPFCKADLAILQLRRCDAFQLMKCEGKLHVLVPTWNHQKSLLILQSLLFPWPVLQTQQLQDTRVFIGFHPPSAWFPKYLSLLNNPSLYWYPSYLGNKPLLF